jgi:hypothetical protein
VRLSGCKSEKDILYISFHIVVYSHYFYLTCSTYEPRRHAAVLVLKELAQNSPTLFYVHVSSFVELIWVTLRDPKVLHPLAAKKKKRKK